MCAHVDRPSFPTQTARAGLAGHAHRVARRVRIAVMAARARGHGAAALDGGGLVHGLHRAVTPAPVGPFSGLAGRLGHHRHARYAAYTTGHPSACPGAVLPRLPEPEPLPPISRMMSFINRKLLCVFDATKT